MLKKHIIQRAFQQQGIEYVISFFDHWLSRSEYKNEIVDITDENLERYQKNRVDLFKKLVNKNIYMMYRNGRFKKLGQSNIEKIIDCIAQSDDDYEFRFYFEESRVCLILGFDYTDRIIDHSESLSIESLKSLIPSDYSILEVNKFK